VKLFSQGLCLLTCRKTTVNRRVIDLPFSPCNLLREVAGGCCEAAVGWAALFVHWKSTSMAAEIHPQPLRDLQKR
jgi:hypothetical protein